MLEWYMSSSFKYYFFAFSKILCITASLFIFACSTVDDLFVKSQSDYVPELHNNTDIPKGGMSIITHSPEMNFNLQRGENNGPVGNARSVNVSHPLFDKAIEINVNQPNGLFWNGQINFPINQPVAKGDKVLLHVYFKMIESADETGSGFINVFVESPAPDHTKYLMYQLVSTGEWQEYYLPMTIGENFKRNEIFLKFGFGNGSKSQTIQLANITLLNYANRIALKDLPATQATYLGRGADEAWREEAADRIEKHRKGDFSIFVEDDNADPLSNATIQVKMLKHAYHFGTVAASRHLVSNKADSLIYKKKLLENFNQSGLENSLKWGAWLGEWGDNYNQNDTIEALNWLQDNDLYTRGHVMVWPSKRNMPKYVQHWLPENLPQQADREVLNQVSQHIFDISTKTQGLINEWDVLNEPFDNHYLMDAFGNQILLDWFNQAKNENPNAQLYINDYSIISGGGTNTSHQEHYFKTIDYLVSNNAPIHGIGFQGHFSTTPTPISKVFDIINRYHQAFPMLAIRTTEFDIDTIDEQLQADYTRDFLTIFFSHPATVGIQKWGFWEGAHWRPNAAMYRQDWAAKPNQKAWSETVYQTFWNDFSGLTDNEGEFEERGFYGDYAVIVDVDGSEQSFLMRLRHNGPTTFTISVK
jgi:endo-1,4-beta-xylanase